MSEELVVLLDDAGNPIGTTPKATVHTEDTPLHRAFSCFVHNEQGQILLTRRALSKKTWPGVWTNSFCGHPGPDEPDTEAIARRAQDELGMRITDITEVLPDFRYRAIDASGIVENEICPVHVAVVDEQPSANPDEVAEWEWVDVDDLLAAVIRTPFAFSPWLAEQLPLLRRHGEV